MNTYLILNGVHSNTIPGLLIQSLPPVKKPKIRANIEQIDGRDGDIVTPLGYSAYDKEVSIGLYGNYDVDEIINYFNSSGQVTFSNEPNKYYNYEILDQIQFDKLIRYRTAKVKFHIQPFKYSVDDNTKNFTFNTANLINLQEWYDNRSDLSVTSGTFSITNDSVTINGTNATLNGTYSSSVVPNTAQINTINTFGSEILGNTEYTLSYTIVGSGNINILFYDTNKKYISSIEVTDLTKPFVFTTPVNSKYICLKLASSTGTFSISDLALQLQQTATFTINNSGNIYSKPKITIIGSGVIGMYLNNNQIFNIELNNFTSITIDATQMEAYNNTQLLNRYVTGNYDNLKLNTGPNTISFSGNVTEVEIQNYSRWI